MAKVKSPLLSLSASGSIGKSFVLASWRGVAYARQHVVPSNPRTDAQTRVRDIFTALNREWRLLGPLARAPWIAQTAGRPLIDRNAFLKSNVKPANDDVTDTLVEYISSAGALGGFALADLALAGDASNYGIEATADVPVIPTGWTLTSISFIAIPDREPTTLPSMSPLEATEAYVAPAAQVTHSFDTTDAARDWVCTAFPVWERPDGKIAYGPSLTTAPVTPT